MKESKLNLLHHTRLNRTDVLRGRIVSLVEMTRCMLNDSGLPKKFWGEAIMTANHLQNRLPVDGKGTTPYEGWNKRKPDLSYVKEFGSVAYVSIPTEKRQKLDDKARKLVFVGYE